MGVGMGNVADDDPGNEGAVLSGNLIHAIFDLARGDLEATRQFGGRRGGRVSLRRPPIERAPENASSNVLADLCKDRFGDSDATGGFVERDALRDGDQAADWASVVSRSRAVTLLRSTNGWPTMGSYNACRIWDRIRATRGRKIAPADVT